MWSGTAAGSGFVPVHLFSDSSLIYIDPSLSRLGLWGFFLGGNHLLQEMELLQAKEFSLLQVLLVFCCSSIRKTEPCLSLDRTVFYDPKKVFV